MIEAQAAIARSRALHDYRDGDHSNPYPPGQEHSEYERVMEQMYLREELGETA